MASSSSYQWEDLHREARRLENQIDQKLLSYSKMGTNFAQAGVSSPQYDIESGPDESTQSQRVCESMELEIEQLLSKLREVNNSMESNMVVGQPANAPLQLQRHRDILYDYVQEFKRTKDNVLASRNRAQLLSSVRQDISQYKNSGLNSRTSRLAGERDMLLESENLTDTVISQANAARERLIAQREIFNNITGKLTGMSARFPTVNNIIQRIQKKKRRDMIILSLVIAVCLILTIFYLIV